MKTLSAKANKKGLTLIEVLVVVVVVFILAAMLLPALADSGHKGSNTIRCMSNQKQIAIGFTMWKTDHGDQFPWQVATTNGGSLEAATRGYAAANFQCLSNYLHTTTVLICQTDTSRVQATNFTQFRNLNVSYFVSIDSGTNEVDSILTGDRNLAGDGMPLNPGLFIHSPISKMNWTRELHNTNPRHTLGVLSFGDGHSEAVTDMNLNSTFLRGKLAANRLAIP